MPRISWTDGDGHEQQMWKYTSHDLRHRFAITALDNWDWTASELQLAGGWATAAVIFARYYGTAEEALASMKSKTG